jgi:DNA-binding transcriptional LysR family regulator
MHRSMDWDDLHLVLAVFREGTLSGAARRLNVTHSTVFRRLGAIEEKIGARLFERFRDGYAPTPAGETAAASAVRLEDEVLTLERKLSGQDLKPFGTVRIATTDTLGAILMWHLPAMRALHPEIQLEIAISNAMANLTRREADIAIRPTPRRQRSWWDDAWRILRTRSTAHALISRGATTRNCWHMIGSGSTMHWQAR